MNIALSILLLGFAEPFHGEFGSEKLQVGGETREYRLVVPKTIDLTVKSPLVFAFHGMAIDSKDAMPRYSKWNELAEKHKFIIVYPNAIRRSWGLNPDKVSKDLAFFDALLEKISGTYKVNSDRVYVMGLSNGGYFAQVVAKERSRVVAAAATHSAPIAMHPGGGRSERKFPIMIIQGDRDPIFPNNLGREGRDKYQREGHEVKYVELTGHGHMWSTSINEDLWKFFDAHPLKK